jgi:hypothetical protein
MFSISKILALLAILAVVWYGFKLVGRLDDARRRKTAARTTERRAEPEVDRPGGGAGGRTEKVVDLVRDETGAYVAQEKRDDRS